MYNSYTSISYKSAAADLHRNLKPLQRMALLSRGFRLYHLHKWNAYSKLDSSFRTANYCRHFLTFDRIQLLLGSVSKIPVAGEDDSRYRTEYSCPLQPGTLPLFCNSVGGSPLS